MTLDKQYQFLQCEVLPAHLQEAMKFYGLKETPGSKHNPIIMGWASEINPAVKGWYDADEKAWCALFVGICLKRAGFEIPKSYDAIRALSYKSFGVPLKSAELGAVLVFGRSGGGHVGFYVGEDDKYFHVLGGNQKDEVNIMRLEKKRIEGICSPKYDTKPSNVRRIMLSANGPVSTNEA